MAGLTKCPECGASVVHTDNEVLLDPATTWDEYTSSWTLMHVAGQVWATNGDPPADGRGHALHQHQIPGSIMAG